MRAAKELSDIAAREAKVEAERKRLSRERRERKARQEAEEAARAA